MKSKNISQFIYIILLTIIAGYILSIKHFRLDLTSEKRYTLSDVTKETLKNLNDAVYIKVYLYGDMPIQFKKMQTAIRDLLYEYEIIAKGDIEYEFINPYEQSDTKIRNELFNSLYEKGIQPVNVMMKDDEGGNSEKYIFPGATIFSNGIEIGISLLKNNPGLQAEVNLNNSIQDLEYMFTSMISNLQTKEIKKIAFIEGHGELDQFQTGDITRELANYYQVDRGVINGKVGGLDNYEVIIIAQPTKRFNEEDKFVLDQYLMQGGNIAIFTDAAFINEDSLSQGSSLAYFQELNIEDLLFKYGVRVNPNLVQDIQCNVIPINTAIAGASPKFVPAPWLYHPMLIPAQNHAITTSVNFVEGKFVSYIDTVGGNKNIIKKPLLATSKFSRVVSLPKIVSLSEVRDNPDQKTFTKSHLPVAVLLEGIFESVFTNRPVDKYLENSGVQFKSSSIPSKMLVVADGDIIKNHVKYTANGPSVSPLGFDRFTKQTFGNKNFIVNAINYLTDETGLMQLRNRRLTIRLLNKQKLDAEKPEWQLINIILPPLLIVGIGVIIFIQRKKKYEIS